MGNSGGIGPDDVLSFWLEDLTPAQWYEADDALDQRIRDRFRPVWEEARAGGLAHWRDGPRGALAFLIVTDQFPRNMFRGRPEAFATDPLARAATQEAVVRGWDLGIPEPERQFFYLPLEHSEDIDDQDRSVMLVQSAMPETGATTLIHARAHREIIRRFGRFPFRNKALDRTSTPEEEAFLAEGGYGAVVRMLQAGG
ncbi:MAG: DUF924 family protein [Paracoccaceae bacterium]